MAKKEDDELLGGSGEHNAEVPVAEPPPSRLSSSDVTASAPPAPRAARFGEGPEGRAARRERAGAVPHRPNFFERIGQFVRDTRAELKRVSWPTALDVRNTTIITIIAVVFFALYLFAIDWTFTKLIGLLERFINWLFGAV